MDKTTTNKAAERETRDPADLRPHPLIKPMPRWAKGTPEWEAFVEDIRLNGIKVPLGIQADGTLVEGETRRRAALALKLQTVPVEVIPDDEVAQTILRHLLLRRNLGKSALAYVGYPLIEAAHEEAKERAKAQLRRGDSPVRQALPDGAKRVEDFAESMGISERLFRQAAQVREIFVEDPEFRDEMEPRILDTVDPVGLGAVIAGYAGRKATSGKAKGKRSNEQLELFAEAWTGLGKRLGYWEKMDAENKDKVIPILRKTVSAMTPELRDELKRAIKAADQDAKA
ncbi:MAG: hypothetical protein U1G08_17810 [Verrucomicrobiota bacterium]